MRWTRSPARWIGSLLWQTFWGLPVCMLATTVAIVAVLLRLDRAGASVAVARIGWPFDFPGKTAQALTSALVDVHVALVALYFSISLLVLTLAAGNLGVRLVHRWISSRVTRVTLGLLLSSVVWSLIALQAIDADATGAHIARLTITVLVAVTIGTIGWLAVALHHLGRTIHIDTAIAALRDEIVADVTTFDNCVSAPPSIDWYGAETIVAPRDGYIESIGFRDITSIAAGASAHVRITARVGMFVMAGEMLAEWTSADPINARRIAGRFSLGRYRTSSQGATFNIRLIVEIAARALSPAINDFYTALACVDALGPAMVAHGHQPQEAVWLGDNDNTAHVLVELSPFEDLFDAPLKSLRQAAAAYPSVAIRLITMLGRVGAQLSAPAPKDFVRHHAEAVAEHAMEVSRFLPDRDAIHAALTATFSDALLA